MQLTKEQLKKIQEFAKKQIQKNDPWHDLFHIKQTLLLVKKLAKKEKADINKCIVITWLHDIAKHKDKEKYFDESNKNNTNHGDLGAKKAEKFLKKLNFKEQDIKEICYAIERHNKGGEKKTKEAKIIWDADKLQAIGAYGIIRNMGHAVTEGKNHVQAYEKNMKEQNFYIKRFYTKTGRKIAKKHFKFLKKFDKKYKKILNARI